MNEVRAAADDFTPVARNTLNCALHAGGGLYTGVVENTKTNQAQAAADAVAPEEPDTTNAPAEAST